MQRGRDGSKDRENSFFFVQLAIVYLFEQTAWLKRAVIELGILLNLRKDGRRGHEFEGTMRESAASLKVLVIEAHVRYTVDSTFPFRDGSIRTTAGSEGASSCLRLEKELFLLLHFRFRFLSGRRPRPSIGAVPLQCECSIRLRSQ